VGSDTSIVHRQIHDLARADYGKSEEREPIIRGFGAQSARPGAETLVEVGEAKPR